MRIQCSGRCRQNANKVSKQVKTSAIKGYCLGTQIAGNRYLHIWGSRFLRCLSGECLIGQQGGRVVHSSKLQGIFQNHNFCTSLTVVDLTMFYSTRNIRNKLSKYKLAQKFTIAAIPLLVSMYRTCIRPYSISAADSTNSFCSSVNMSPAENHTHTIK